MTPREAVTIRKAPQVIMVMKTVWFAPTILRKLLLIAVPPRIKIARETAYAM